MSVSGPITPGPIEKKVVEVGDFPFFADDVKHNIERNTQPVSSGIGSSLVNNGLVVKDESYTGTLRFEGAFVREELDNITRDQSGVPRPLDIEVRSMFEEHHFITFEGALVSSIQSNPEDGSYQTELELVAKGIAKTGP